MSLELTLNATLAYEDSTDGETSLQVTDKQVTLTTVKYTQLRQSIGITEEALVLGEVTSLGWIMVINRDLSNFVNLKVATSGAIFAKLFPGEFCFLRLGSGAQAPFLIADTAPCVVEFLLISV